MRNTKCKIRNTKNEIRNTNFNVRSTKQYGIAKYELRISNADLYIRIYSYLVLMFFVFSSSPQGIKYC
jgi:hypothetical protein